MPSCGGLLNDLKQPIREEEAARRRRVLPRNGLDDGAVLNVERTDRSVEAGKVEPDVGEVSEISSWRGATVVGKTV